MERETVVGLEVAQEAVADAARTVHFSGNVEYIPAIAEIFSMGTLSVRSSGRAAHHSKEVKNALRTGRQVAGKPHPAES